MATSIVKFLTRRGFNNQRARSVFDQGELALILDESYQRLYVGVGGPNGSTMPVGSKFFYIKNWVAGAAISNNAPVTLSFVEQNDIVFVTDTSKLYALTGNDSTLSGSYMQIASV